MNLLQTLQVVQARGCVSEGPHSEIVHVGKDFPVVAEGDLLAWLEEFIDVIGLAVVARDAQGVPEGLLAGLEISQLVHYYLFI